LDGNWDRRCSQKKGTAKIRRKEVLIGKKNKRQAYIDGERARLPRLRARKNARGGGTLKHHRKTKVIRGIPKERKKGKFAQHYWGGVFCPPPPKKRGPESP